VTYRVIQWATGGIGRAAIQGIVSHPELELAGVWVHSPDKVGRDVGDIVGDGPMGLSATDDVDALLRLEADCVLYAPVVANRPELLRILEAGKNVVTPLNWFYRGSRDWSDLEDACQKSGVTLHGTGIHPGGITERFPLMISALSRAVTHVRAEEWSDIRSYGAPQVVGELMLFGKTPDEARKSPMTKLLGDGFCQSIDMVADTLGFAVEPEKRITHEVSAATRPIDSPIGVIEPGQVAGRRFHWEAMVGDTVVVRITVNWLMGSENLDPPWSFGPAGERYEIEVHGNPDTFVTVKGWQPGSVEAGLQSNPGIVATAAHCVNAIPATCAAPAGIQSFFDLPPITGRAAPRLAR
jgi:hypothetical protein